MASSKNPLPQGYHSKAQWRYFFVKPKLARYAHTVAHRTWKYKGGPKIAYRRLPVHASTSGRLLGRNR